MPAPNLPPSQPHPATLGLPIRLRKLIGTVILVPLVVIYALLAVALAGAVLPGTPWWVHALFFFVGGFVWILPSMAIIWWMTRPDAPRSP